MELGTETNPKLTHERSTWVPFMLLHRMGLFLILQGLIAIGFALTGSSVAWSESVAWWPVAAVLTNLISIGLLRNLARREGLRLRQLFNVDRQRSHIGKDLLALLGVLVLSAPIAMIPNTGLAKLLFGDGDIALAMFIRPLPPAAALAALVLFPLTIAFAELPTYFGYVMPRLTTRLGSAWAVVLAALGLAAQHVTLPFIPDTRFILWRLGMFIPFALLLGVVIRWRPRLLPYLMVVHALIDFSVAFMVWQVSVG